MEKETYISDFNRDSIHTILLNNKEDEIEELFKMALNTRQEHCGSYINLRGIIEYSNICKKDCYYCGIRKDNGYVKRYQLTEDEVIASAYQALENGLGSIVIQSGEQSSKEFILTIDRLIQKIKKLSNNKLGITLSCGEQSEETYRRWFESGAHRYLLRIETSNEALYKKLHPDNLHHSYFARKNALEAIKKTGYQTGSGVMIGVPFQTPEHLAEDLLFLRDFDVDMVGMGPYVEEQNTPLYLYSAGLPSLQQRFVLSMKMIALLRLMMPNINIAASTALDAVNKEGRFEALKAGANVLMPNLTPAKHMQNYSLYNGKTRLSDNCQSLLNEAARFASSAGDKLRFNQWGDSRHYLLRTNKHEEVLK